MLSAPDIALNLTDVHRTVGRGRRRAQVLHGVDLTARRGAVTVLLGPNGAGKSTTLSLCHGITRPDAGTVRVFGHDPAAASADLRARIAVMWQESGLPPSVSARRFVEHVCRLHRDPVPAADVFERLGISDCADRAIRRLSGGQRQRVALAAALVGRPDMLFLDEPTAGLDPQTRPLVHEVIREQTQRGAAVLLTTHLLDDAERLADDVAILSGGRVVRHGRLEELTRIDGGDVVEIDFGDAPSEALRRWADDCPEGMRAESPAAGGLVRLTGVSSPSDMRRLAESWSRHRLLPVRFDRVSQRLETVLEEVSR
ncbi:ABC transporter ATP-binding protein [Micrococcus cohnii]|uniref:ABC-2 type transport system ATP-binding protein n=1 Tax=Micrococcus cohnii TaxID=993416 RepID=A0A7W7GN50_9MICC|nr:ABC transporter ATP-binding protein [uncultured Micrococcus sp.]MBB4735218.1 ABC-2 type transport system ATP-binding protein [Micrococcus cohnii]